MANENIVYATTEVFGALVATACEQSAAFRDKFVHNPQETLNQFLTQNGAQLRIDDNVNIMVHENDAATLHVAVPAYSSSSGARLSDAQLEQIAAGEVVGSVAGILGVLGAAATLGTAGTAASIAIGAAVVGAATLGAVGVTAGVAGITVGALAATDTI